MQNKKINVAIVGYGNIGRYALNAVLVAKDMNLVGIVRRSTNNLPKELQDIKVVTDIKELGDVDVAILATPSRSVLETAKKYLELGINTVDSFDIHSKIYELRQELDDIAKKNNAVSIVSAGWDPGTDSIVRTLFEAMTPKGVTHTNFGEGMSMGHSVAARAIEVVKDALSVTIPVGSSVHRRMLYIELVDGADFIEVSKKIKADPYFAYDETIIKEVSCVSDLVDVGHGVNMVRKGVSGQTHNQLLEFNMKINNPALTSQILVCAARATTKQVAGAYTMIEIPPVDFLDGNLEDLISRLV